jgi:hypothetical protein
VVDPKRRLPAQAFFTTALTLTPARVIELLVWRWSLEMTFEETRRHLGVETQRQWSDLAIARTTPVLMALFSLVCLMVHRWRAQAPGISSPRRPSPTAWPWSGAGFGARPISTAQPARKTLCTFRLSAWSACRSAGRNGLRGPKSAKAELYSTNQ